ncbi:Xaa-Pro peptidase family protein [Alphaproteobacteria bacterium]|nr:Xaa-Pro peptidase family protein [Alphaproteobacteria bacterium]
MERRIGPKFDEGNRSNYNFNKVKPRLYEDQINFDRMRMYRLNRVREQLLKNDIGACILFDPINVRYATDTTNMAVFSFHLMTRYVFIPASGPVILFEYPKCEHIFKNNCTIDEVRHVVSWDFFSWGNNVYQKALEWAKTVDELMKKHSSDNNNLAIDVCDPAGINALQNNCDYKLCNAQKYLEIARSIKSEDEIVCLKASIETAEKGISLMHEKLQANMTEEEVWAYLHKTNIENGGEWIETRLLSSGSRTNPWLQECSNRIIQKGDLVAFDTDMVGPYGYCADISRTFVEGRKLNDEQKKLHDLAYENIKYNEQLIKPGVTFREFAEKAWKLPDNCYDNHYPCQVHGIGMCDEWPFIAYPDKDYSNGDYSGVFEEHMVICVESYIGEVGGKEGVKLENQYLVTNSGLQLLTSHPLKKV